MINIIIDFIKKLFTDTSQSEFDQKVTKQTIMTDKKIQEIAKEKKALEKIKRLEERLENLFAIEDNSSFEIDTDELQRGIDDIKVIAITFPEGQRRITQLQHKLDTLRESKKSNKVNQKMKLPDAFDKTSQTVNENELKPNKVNQKMKLPGAFDKISQTVNESKLKPKNKNRGRGNSPQMGI